MVFEQLAEFDRFLGICESHMDVLEQDRNDGEKESRLEFINSILLSMALSSVKDDQVYPRAQRLANRLVKYWVREIAAN